MALGTVIVSPISQRMWFSVPGSRSERLATQQVLKNLSSKILNLDLISDIEKNKIFPPASLQCLYEFKITRNTDDTVG